MSLTRAIETGDLAELPSRRDEDWRWTDLRGLIRALPPKSERVEGDAEKGPIGRYDGLVGPGPFDAAADRSMATVNGERQHVTLQSGDRPISLALRFIAKGAGAHACGATIVVAPGTRAVLLESYEALDDGYVREIDLEIDIRAGASLERIVLAADRADAVSVSCARLRLSKGATFAQTVLTDGAKRQRTETRIDHRGHGAMARLDGVYVLGDTRHADITTVVELVDRDGAVAQLTKGCVRDQARGVFQGRIIVDRGADGTDARMGHHALILSERAEVDAKPELEIYADDVACSHGNTVGALDEEALFYIEQRGVPEAEARALLTEAFVGEVVDRIEHEGARDIARAWVAERLRTAP
jgi:Fe-S cluster assembly protein SufD